jgi:hypothetical protein
MIFTPLIQALLLGLITSVPLTAGFTGEVETQDAERRFVVSK